MTKPTKWHVRSAKPQDETEHSSSPIRVFAVHMKKAWVLSYPLSAQRRLWSDWAGAKADLSLRRAHSHFVGFVMRRLFGSESEIHRRGSLFYRVVYFRLELHLECWRNINYGSLGDQVPGKSCAALKAGIIFQSPECLKYQSNFLIFMGIFYEFRHNWFYMHQKSVNVARNWVLWRQKSNFETDFCCNPENMFGIVVTLGSYRYICHRMIRKKERKKDRKKGRKEERKKGRKRNGIKFIYSLTYEYYMSPVKRICVFEHSVMTNFNCACPAIQRGQGSGFLSVGSSWLTACMSEQRRFWRDCADAQARLNLRCSHMR